jgi:hypothetical protein
MPTGKETMMSYYEPNKSPTPMKQPNKTPAPMKRKIILSLGVGLALAISRLGSPNVPHTPIEFTAEVIGGAGTLFIILLALDFSWPRKWRNRR